MKGFKSGRVLKNQSAFLKDWSSLNFLQHCFINIITITMDFFLKLLCSKSALKPTKSKSEINTEVRKCHCMVYNENNHIFYKCRIFFIFWFVRSLGGSAALWGNLRLSCSQDKLILWKIQCKCERSLSPRRNCMHAFLWLVVNRLCSPPTMQIHRWVHFTTSLWWDCWETKSPNYKQDVLLNTKPGKEWMLFRCSNSLNSHRLWDAA